MGNLSKAEKKKIPRYDDQTQIEMGLVQFDLAKCNGCSLCVKACPADAIKLQDKKAKLNDNPECMACGDCVAICSEKAVTLVKSYRYSGRYKTIDQGGLELPRL
jgi:heterodisulfide reductase subunit A-like polyferredoxin